MRDDYFFSIADVKNAVRVIAQLQAGEAKVVHFYLSLLREHTKCSRTEAVNY